MNRPSKAKLDDAYLQIRKKFPKITAPPRRSLPHYIKKALRFLVQYRDFHHQVYEFFIQTELDPLFTGQIDKNLVEFIKFNLEDLPLAPFYMDPIIDEKPISDAQFRSEKAQFCPNCRKSGGIVFKDKICFSATIGQDVSCNLCGAKWVAHFKLDSYYDLET